MTLEETEYIREQTELGLFQVRVQHARQVNARICKIYKITFGGNMTPQEELFSKFFQKGKLAVKDMSILDRRAYREEIETVALEARAILSAIEWADREDKPKQSGITGFNRNVNIDDISSDAINAIERRQDKLSKKDKIKKTLLDMGVADSEVEKIMSARNIRDTVNRPISQPKSNQAVVNPLTGFKFNIADLPEPKPVNNPFLKKI